MKEQQGKTSDLMSMVASTPKGEITHQVSCRSCGETITIDNATYEHYEMNKHTGVGFTMPKCKGCWL